MPSRSPLINDDWILSLRPAKNRVDPSRPYAHLVEPERSMGGVVEDVATLFLTNAECPFRCLMCDLWKNTTDEPVPRGAIPGQMRWALDQMPPARHIKLYNSGNFFDRRAIPPEDCEEIASIVEPFETVIVESHPRTIGRRCFEFSEMAGGSVHVAMGLETVHPGVLPRLNKRMTLDDFASATQTLLAHGMQARAFILLRPPFLSESEGLTWAKRSIDFAFDAGVECCAVIPTRGGNGAMEYLAETGQSEPPTLASLESVMDYGLGLNCGRVFVDLWDIERVTPDAPAKAARVQRLSRMNLSQSPEPAGGTLGTCDGKRVTSSCSAPVSLAALSPSSRESWALQSSSSNADNTRVSPSANRPRHWRTSNLLTSQARTTCRGLCRLRSTAPGKRRIPRSPAV